MWSHVQGLWARLTRLEGTRARLLVLAAVVLLVGLVAVPVMAQDDRCPNKPNGTQGELKADDHDCDGIPGKDRKGQGPLRVSVLLA
jgi:hypothetical protein